MRRLILTLALVATAAPFARGATHFVAVSSATPQSPYITWPTAAQTIQDAADVSVERGGRICEWSLGPQLTSDQIWRTSQRRAPGNDGEERDCPQPCRLSSPARREEDERRAPG